MFIDSQTAIVRSNTNIYTGNNYVYQLDTPLRGVCTAELLSATFSRTSNLHNMVLDIDELKTDRLVANPGVTRSFAIIPMNTVSFGSNVLYTTNGFFPIKQMYHPRDIDRLTVRWRDQSGNIVSSSDNSFIIKFTHLK